MRADAAPVVGVQPQSHWEGAAAPHCGGRRPESSASDALSTDYGRLIDRGGVGVFFCWLDPHAPLSANDLQLPAGGGEEEPSAAPHPLPQRYAANIAGWSALYGQAPCVFNGADMAAAVREVSGRPEFVLPSPYLAPAAHGADEGDLIGSLWQLYVHLAGQPGGWIQCVDLARLAILWLAGGGSAYVDTDMSPGAKRLPPELMSPGGGGTAPAVPLLVLPLDADGLLQNNFLAIAGRPGVRHPFLTLLLQAILLGAPFEPHVLSATGPALLTALLLAVSHCAVPGKAPAGKGAVCALRAALPCADEGASLLSRATAAPHGTTGLTYCGTVHVLTTSAFYPMHWHGAVLGSGALLEPQRGGGGMAPAPPHSRSTAGFGPLEGIQTGIPGLSHLDNSFGIGMHAHPKLVVAEEGVSGLAPPFPATPGGVYGTHGWDTTWGTYGEGYGGYAGYGGGYSGALGGYSGGLASAEMGSAAGQHGTPTERDAYGLVTLVGRIAARMAGGPRLPGMPPKWWWEHVLQRGRGT
jgi:hypothetical protein